MNSGSLCPHSLCSHYVDILLYFIALYSNGIHLARCGMSITIKVHSICLSCAFSNTKFHSLMIPGNEFWMVDVDNLQVMR